MYLYSHVFCAILASCSLTTHCSSRPVARDDLRDALKSSVNAGVWIHRHINPHPEDSEEIRLIVLDRTSTSVVALSHHSADALLAALQIVRAPEYRLAIAEALIFKRSNLQRAGDELLKLYRIAKKSKRISVERVQLEFQSLMQHKYPFEKLTERELKQNVYPYTELSSLKATRKMWAKERFRFADHKDEPSK